jgi:hypothetical protein
VAYHSFGGWKRSLFGDLHAYSSDAVRFNTKRSPLPSAGLHQVCAKAPNLPSLLNFRLF